MEQGRHTHRIAGLRKIILDMWKDCHTRLPQNWAGACVLGTIHLSFFLLPLLQGEQLGIPVYEEKGHPRSQRAIQKSLQIGNWKDDKWPLKCIIHYYGPTTWAEDGSWDYQTPIYMLNCIIWLQEVVEIITNETAKALNILAKQSTKMHSEIYQNCLALDYLLASEGGSLWQIQFE
jgi:hypothetical protein